jgi:hypothetical protein
LPWATSSVIPNKRNDKTNILTLSENRIKIHLGHLIGLRGWDDSLAAASLAFGSFASLSHAHFGSSPKCVEPSVGSCHHRIPKKQAKASFLGIGEGGMDSRLLSLTPAGQLIAFAVQL